MCKHLLTFFLFLAICSDSYSQNSNNDTLFYKATLKPQKSSEPTVVTKHIKARDASYLSFFISKDNITAKIYNHSTQLSDSNSIQKFLIDNKTKIDKSKVAIIKEKNGSIDKFKELVEMLKKNGITNFSLVSQ